MQDRGQTLVRIGGKPDTWRSSLRKIVGDDGKLWRIMLELAEGRAYRPVLPDGTEGPPIVPSPEIRLRATVELADRLYGKAVSATEQVQAEQAANDLEAIRALSDGELAQRVKGALERGLAKLDARKAEVSLQEACQVWWGADTTLEDPIDSTLEDPIDSTTPGHES